jgi:hypothetical protein
MNTQTKLNSTIKIYKNSREIRGMSHHKKEKIRNMVRFLKYKQMCQLGTQQNTAILI